MGLFSYISGLSNGNIENNDGYSDILDLQAIPDKDALRKNCDIDFIFEQYQNGNLVEWLRFHNCEREYIQIENIKASDKGVVCQKLAEILQMDKVCGQEYIKMLEDENAKLKLQVAELENKLKQITIAGTNKSMRKNLCIGDTIKFGKYPQSGAGSLGKDPIEWQVLAVEGKRALLISKYGLDAVRFHHIDSTNQWDSCNLRSWLNGVFLKTAFTGEEARQIATTNVEANVSDKLFLLSVAEVNKYFTSDNVRKCKATDYAKENGALTTYSENCYWWLRSAGINMPNAATVDRDGYVDAFGTFVFNTSICVRPAMWVNL